MPGLAWLGLEWRGRCGMLRNLLWFKWGAAVLQGWKVQLRAVWGWPGWMGRLLLSVHTLITVSFRLLLSVQTLITSPKAECLRLLLSVQTLWSQWASGCQPCTESRGIMMDWCSCRAYRGWQKCPGEEETVARSGGRRGPWAITTRFLTVLWAMCIFRACHSICRVSQRHSSFPASTCCHQIPAPSGSVSLTRSLGSPTTPRGVNAER